MTTSNNNNDESQQFCVRWNSHLGSLGAAFPHLLAGQQFVDVTLACDGHQLHCHRLVLAACSSFFESLFSESPCKHPIIILPRDIKLWEIQALVDFMYKGEVHVSQAGLTDLLKCAEILQIRGLSGNDSTVNLNTIKDHNLTTLDNNIQNELLTTNGLTNQIVTESEQISINNNNNNNSSKLITTNNFIIPPVIPISTLNNNNIPLITSLSGINTDIISIKSPKTLTNDKIDQQEQNKLIINNSNDNNIIDKNDINNEENDIILLSSSNNNNFTKNNNDTNIIPITKSSTTTTSIINNDNNCNINKHLTSFTTVSIKPEYNIQKNNIKGCGNISGSGRGGHNATCTGVIPFIVPKIEPFDTSMYDESIDETILTDDEIDLMNSDTKSNNHDFPLSNVVCEYDSNGLQINMETPGRRVRRSETILRQAAECVSKGQTFQTVSDMFSIPISTIRFFMARKGILPRRKRGRTAGVMVMGSNGIISGIGNIRNSTMVEIHSNSNNLTSTNLNRRSKSPLGPPFHFATYKLPELKPKLLLSFK